MNDFMSNLLSSKRRLFVVAGSLGGLISGILVILLSLDDNPYTSWILAGAFDAALISALIISGQTYYQTKKIIEVGKLKSALMTGALIGAGGGVIALIAMGVLGQGEFGRFIGWGISGGAAGFVVSRQVANMNKLHAIAAGAIGGAIGCIAMNIDFGYITGVGITGAAIGFSVALADEVLRKNWVQVTEYSDNLKSSGINMAKVNNKYILTLGNQPVRLGYSSDMEIQLKAEGVSMEKEVAVLTMEASRCFLMDLKTGIKSELLKDFPVIIKNCELRFDAK